MTRTVPTNDVDVLRAQVGHRRSELSEQASAFRLVRTADHRPTRRTTVVSLLTRCHLRLWWVFRPRGAELRRLLWSETAVR